MEDMDINVIESALIISKYIYIYTIVYDWINTPLCVKPHTTNDSAIMVNHYCIINIIPIKGSTTN